MENYKQNDELYCTADVFSVDCMGKLLLFQNDLAIVPAARTFINLIIFPLL